MCACIHVCRSLCVYDTIVTTDGWGHNFGYTAHRRMRKLARENEYSCLFGPYVGCPPTATGYYRYPCGDTQKREVSGRKILGPTSRIPFAYRRRARYHSLGS